MEFNQSRKVLLITNKKNIEPPIRQALNKHGLDVATSYLNLYSISSIRKGIAASGKTAFIRTELMRFIKEQGFPYAVIIDSYIETGRDDAHDPDKLKILKTLLISYIILSRGSEFEKLRGNFLILTEDPDFDKKYQFSIAPYKTLDLLVTANEGINSIINELKQDRKSFNMLFFIKILDLVSSPNEMTMFIDNFINGIEVKNKLSSTEKSSSFEQADKPARIIFKINENSAYDDGQIMAAGDLKDTPFNENEFYIIGPWSNKTHLDVSAKLIKAITRGLADRKRFKKEETIIINMDDRCITDGTTAASLAQVIIKNLNDYKKISIVLSPKNDEILRKAQGFSMIKNIVHIKKVIT